MRLRTAWHILRYLGPRFVWQRVRITAENKAGKTKRVYAPRPWESIRLPEICAAGTPTEAADYEAFKRNQGIAFIGPPSAGPEAGSGEPGAGSRGACAGATPPLAERLRLIEQDRHVYCFRTPSPRPVDWNENGLTGQRARSDAPWYAVADFDPSQGDIRTLWDPARAAWAVDLARGVAHGLMSRERAAALYWRWVDSWMAACPPWRGVQWKCGQESSVRLIGLAIGYHGLRAGGPPDASPDSPRRALDLARIAWATGYRVAHHIDYAVSQKNNHAISEACGLILVSHLFPEFREASRWRSLGRRVLTRELRRQIYSDGSYVQHSMNYQRVMMHGAILALRLAELQHDPLPRDLYDRLERCARFMHALLDPPSGRMPNYGNNDGACVLPLTECDYADFRPVIQSTHFLATRRRLLPSGPWDEEAAWLFGEEFEKSTRVGPAPEPGSAAFSSGGYFTIRNGDSWAMIRSHSYRDRPAHLDMLHLDLWWRGVNILTDAGTYQYFIPERPALERYFKSIRAHNTIEIQGVDPLDAATRFLWLPWPKARVLDSVAPTGEARTGLEFSGEHYAYARAPWHVVHRRTVRARRGRWVVVDELRGRPGQSHDATLRWRLGDGALRLNEATGVVEAQSAAGRVRVSVRLSDGRTPSLRIVCGDEQGELSYSAPYYAELQATPTLMARAAWSGSLTFETQVELG